MQVGELFSGSFSVIAATALIYALFALLRAVSRLVVNKAKLEKIEVEVKSWEERRRRAIQSRDMKLYERVQREQARIDKLRREADLERMKASAVSIVAWPILLTLLWRVTGDPVVALAPAPWDYMQITFSAWFIANAVWANALLDRIASLLHQILTAKRQSHG
ncbi:MAG: hypothetical protein QW407_01610 [Thermofilaceae archaeon]